MITNANHCHHTFIPSYLDLELEMNKEVIFMF